VDPLDSLRAATCSNGAPSARNLLVTVFGDALLPHGDTTAVSVRSLAALLEPFGVNDRLVRTSLTRLVNDGLLAVRSEGRRSRYRVAPAALDLFARADERIYGALASDWDGAWTIVVIDGNEGTARDRVRLRQELVWIGLGPVAPNVMASPVVSAEAATGAVGRVGRFSHVMVGRTNLVEGPSTLSGDELARRCAPLDELADRYAGFCDRFEPLVEHRVTGDPALAFKLRVLLVASYRRIVLADPLLPVALVPAGWVGYRARQVAARVYDACIDTAEQHLVAVAGEADGLLGLDEALLRYRFQSD
jgi:phenylacetic acid degradation operon negative regulatory protein